MCIDEVPAGRVTQDTVRQHLLICSGDEGTMANTVTVIFDIASFTSVMVLIVLGLGVIASMMGIFNFAHGEFVLLGGYSVYLSVSAGLGLWFGILAVPIAVGLLGLIMERIMVRRFYASQI